jgi:hypothetical protein
VDIPVYVWPKSIPSTKSGRYWCSCSGVMIDDLGSVALRPNSRKQQRARKPGETVLC